MQHLEKNLCTAVGKMRDKLLPQADEGEIEF